MFNLTSDKNAYTVVFHHRHGVNSGVVLADEEPSSEEACKALGWDYELRDESEYVEIDLLTAEEIPTINNCAGTR